MNITEIASPNAAPASAAKNVSICLPPLTTLFDLKRCPDGFAFNDVHDVRDALIQVRICVFHDVLRYNVDAIIYTGGMAYSERFCDEITSYVGKIAPVMRFPGEEEMRALAEGALKALETGHWEIYE